MRRYSKVKLKEFVNKASWQEISDYLSSVSVTAFVRQVKELIKKNHKS